MPPATLTGLDRLHSSLIKRSHRRTPSLFRRCYVNDNMHTSQLDLPNRYPIVQRGFLCLPSQVGQGLLLEEDVTVVCNPVETTSSLSQPDLACIANALNRFESVHTAFYVVKSTKSSQPNLTNSLQRIAYLKAEVVCPLFDIMD